MEFKNLVYGKYLVSIASSPGHTGRVYEDRARWEIIKTASGLDLLVAVVADGVGSTDGSVAAQLAVDTFFQCIQLSEGSSIPHLIETAIKEANLAVFADNEQHHTDNYTTLVAGVIQRDRLYIGNVGDSRAYWVPNSEELVQLSQDHTVYQMYGGDKNNEEADRVVNILGRTPKISVDLGFYPPDVGKDGERAYKLGLDGLDLQPGDSVLICSDGLIKHSPPPERARYVEDSEITEALQNEFFPQNAAPVKMVGFAIGRRVDDNVSVITLQAVTGEVIKKIEEQTGKARRMRALKMAGLAALFLCLLSGLAVLATRLSDTQRSQASYFLTETARPTQTPITIRETVLPTARPIDPGVLRVEDTYDGTPAFIPVNAATELLDGEWIESGSARVRLVFGDQAGTKTVLILGPNSRLMVRFDMSDGRKRLVPELERGALYINVGFSPVKLSLYGGQYAATTDVEMGIQVDAVGITGYCFQGVCQIENLEKEDFARIEANSKRRYDTLQGVKDDGVLMVHDDMWAWEQVCSCLGVQPPTPTPTLTATPTATRTFTASPEPSRDPVALPTDTPLPTKTPLPPTPIPPTPEPRDTQDPPPPPIDTPEPIEAPTEQPPL